MSYEVIYDSTSYALKTYLPETVFFLILIIGIVLLILRKKNIVNAPLYIPIILIVLGILYIPLYIVGRVTEYNNIIKPYKDGDYSIVTGEPQNFDGLDNPNGVDTFTINGIQFIIGIDGPGLQTRAFEGGPIDSEEVYYRITYVSYGDTNYIFKVEIQSEII